VEQDRAVDDRGFIEAISPWLGDNDGPVGARLTLAIRQAIGTGRLPTGLRLPPERVLAKALHVSRPTVSGVIDELRSRGLVTSRQGSGSWISGTGGRDEARVPFVEMIQATGRIDLAAAAAPDAGLLPAMRVETADLLIAEPANGLNPMGLWPLRDVVAERAATFVPGTTGDNVIVTSGAHQALALVVAALAPRGSAVLVEDTTYGGLVDIIRANGCHPVGIDRDGDGPIPAVLDDLIGRHRPSLTILISSVHSPTGTISSPQRCAALAAVLDDTATRVVLDETYAELEFVPSGRPLSTALGDEVIRVGSLSKTLWTGLRTGWIIGPARTCTTLTRQRWQQFDLGPSVASQLFALQAFEGLDDRLVDRCRTLQEKAEWTRDALGAAFPDWRPSPVGGGLAMWVEIPADGARFADEAAAGGVAVLPGSACRADHADTPHIRICFDRPLDVLETAIERLSERMT
jgi:DNA-binding transcriptional MocR family regulator